MEQNYGEIHDRIARCSVNSLETCNSRRLTIRLQRPTPENLLRNFPNLRLNPEVVLSLENCENYEDYIRRKIIANSRAGQPKIILRRLCQLKNNIFTGNTENRQLTKCNPQETNYLPVATAVISKNRTSGRKSHPCIICKNPFPCTCRLKNDTRLHSQGKLDNVRRKIFLHGSSQLRDHERVHTTEKPFPCPLCDKSFSWLSHLKVHTTVHTREKPYKCQFCEKSFPIKSTLKLHVRVHTQEKPYKCQLCGKSFACSKSLKSHTFTHTGEKPFKCDLCDKSFSRSSDLNTHRRLHTGEKPYKCELCDKSFSQAKNIKRHKRTHTGEKPYKCNFCDMLFTNASGLISHTRRWHTGEKSYKCNWCGKSFSETSELKSQ